jgi:hypothetical protein
MGASVKGELHLIMDVIVSYPIQCLLFLLLLFLVFFLFNGKVEGLCPCMVTRGDNITHKQFTEMRRLARDETPFLLAMPPRATTLVW